LATFKSSDKDNSENARAMRGLLVILSERVTPNTSKWE